MLERESIRGQVVNAYVEMVSFSKEIIAGYVTCLSNQSLSPIGYELNFIIRAWTMQNQNKPSIFLKIQPKHRQVISSAFAKIFRGTGYLMVFYELFRDFWGF